MTGAFYYTSPSLAFSLFHSLIIFIKDLCTNMLFAVLDVMIKNGVKLNIQINCEIFSNV